MNLINKSQRLYMLYAFVILVITIPVSYIAIQSIVSEDVDETLAAQKNSLISKLEKHLNLQEEQFPETLSSDFEITPIQGIPKPDSFYTINQYDSISGENLPFRILESNTVIKNNLYKIKIKDSLIDSEDLKERIILIMGVLLLCFVAGLYLINIYISKKIWKPFYQALEKLKQFRVDKMDPILLPDSSIHEFAELNNAIKALTSTNRQVYQSQKEFTENASHEMQTPIAVLQSKIELLMQTLPLSAEQAGLITDTIHIGQKLSRLNKTLLLLAKIDNNQFPEREKINLKAMIEETLKQFEDAIADKKIEVEFGAMDDNSIFANKLLVEILFSNLLSNAVRHNYKNGIIKLSLEQNIFSIINTGDLNALDNSQLFQRFKKQTNNQQSVGLGLELAQKICELYHTKIEYSYLRGLHIFSINFFM